MSLLLALSLMREPAQGVALVRRFNAQLGLSATVLAQREAMMGANPATFFRANPGLFYDDLRGAYREQAELLPRRAPLMLIAGDCHLGNFGTLRTSDGAVLWSLNDFDLARPGSPAEDLARLATSLALEDPQLVAPMAQAYLHEIDRLAETRAPSAAGIAEPEARGKVAKLIANRTQKTQRDLLKTFAQPDRTRLLRNHELAELSAETRQQLSQLLESYDRLQPPTPELRRPLEVLDVAAKLGSGGNTFGLKRFYVLVAATDGLPRILEVKQELPPADAGLLDQRLSALEAKYEPTMAAMTLADEVYLVRERQPAKGSLDEVDSQVAEQAGTVLARVHGRQAQVIREWVGSERQMLIERLQALAELYAEQVKADQAFLNSR
jgi:uncharacterized protein (DUF2252 family)